MECTYCGNDEQNEIAVVCPSCLVKKERRIENLEQQLRETERERDKDIIASNNITAKLQIKVSRLEDQLREMEAMRDEAGRRYITQVQECTDKQREVNRLRECLKRLEWCEKSLVVRNNSSYVGSFCPACNYENHHGHASDCWLAAALKEGE